MSVNDFPLSALLSPSGNIAKADEVNPRVARYEKNSKIFLVLVRHRRDCGGQNCQYVNRQFNQQSL